MTESTDNQSPDERWTIVQVAAYLAMSYQDARNAMLEARFGLSEYDPKTRKLTVSADAVRAEKLRREQAHKVERAKNPSKNRR